MSPETTGQGPDPGLEAEVGAGSLPAKVGPLVAHLRSRVHEEGAFYVKSRFVTEDLELSAKEVGTYMRRLQNSEEKPAVEAWAYTNGTTWYVSARE